jgi:paired amphipathic helix protein Sin3a
MLKEEASFEMTDMERKERWKYYTSSFVRVEPTEGVPRDRVRKTLLTRNLPSGLDTDSDISGSAALQQRKPVLFSEDLVIQVCVNTRKLIWKKNTAEYFVYKTRQDTEAEREREKHVEEVQNQKFREKFAMNSKWMVNLSQSQVQDVNQAFEKWVRDGDAPPAGGVSAAGQAEIDRRAREAAVRGEQ